VSKQGEKGKEDDEVPTLSFAQMEGKWYWCGKPGHRSPDCRQKDKIPKDEWVICTMRLLTNSWCFEIVVSLV
jgi:hypothetical protein